MAYAPAIFQPFSEIFSFVGERSPDSWRWRHVRGVDAHFGLEMRRESPFRNFQILVRVFFPVEYFFLLTRFYLTRFFFFERNIIVPGKRNGSKNWNTLNPNVLLLSSFEKYSRLNLINLIKSEK